jgi:thiamine transport system ATP-binding protein
MAALSLRHITVQYAQRPVLDRFSLDLADGEIVALLGPSGAGKSTALRVAAGLIEPESGSVLLDGTDVTRWPTHRRNIGMVFQDQQLFPHLDVAANVGFGLRMQGLDRTTVARRTAEMLALVGLDGFAARSVASLSGGEATRVALARSLAPSPQVLLLDEPFTGLDRELHDRLVADVAALLRGLATTVLLVTHDHDEAAVIAQRQVRLDTGNALTVRQITATDTHALRLAVLRRDTVTKVVHFPEDDLPDTRHFGLFRADELVATSSWVVRSRDGEQAVQLRGMATAWHLQSTGLGGELLEQACRIMAGEGFPLVWANARDAALDFYTRHQFEVQGDGFIDAATQLPHHVVVRRLK